VGEKHDRLLTDRTKAFLDAAVAIAMTLLILPLMESVADVAGADRSVAHWFGTHVQQLVAFVLSFIVIGMFWVVHHRLFTHIEKVSLTLLVLMLVWLLSIVWLPVATAMSGQMDAEDPLVRVVYIGSMMLPCLLTLAQRLHLLGHPDAYDRDEAWLRRGIAVDAALTILFGAVLALALLFPAVNYAWFFLVMGLTGPLQALLARVLARGSAA
jgi:uncharacterized membrane protein